MLRLGRGGRFGLRSPRAAAALMVGAVCWIVPALAWGAESIASITAHAQIASRTSLNVSTETLHFTVVAPETPATMSVHFSAASRTHDGAHIVLSVELVQPLGYPADGGTALTFDSGGAGRAGTIVPATSAVVARWTGSGRRTGQVVFALRTRAVGTYSVPVRFVLSTP